MKKYETWQVEDPKTHTTRFYCSYEGGLIFRTSVQWTPESERPVVYFSPGADYGIQEFAGMAGCDEPGKDGRHGDGPRVSSDDPMGPDAVCQSRGSAEDFERRR